MKSTLTAILFLLWGCSGNNDIPVNYGEDAGGDAAGAEGTAEAGKNKKEMPDANNVKGKKGDATPDLDADLEDAASDADAAPDLDADLEDAASNADAAPDADVDANSMFGITCETDADCLHHPGTFCYWGMCVSAVYCVPGFTC